MEIFIFLLANLIGFLVGHYLFSGSTAVYVSMLVSYHIVLGILIFLPELGQSVLPGMSRKSAFSVSRNPNERGLSLPFTEATATHLACLALVVGLPYLRSHIPFFGFIRYLIPGVAFFEAQWLFSGGKQKQREEAPQPISGGTAEDHEQFLLYLTQSNRRFSKPGRTINEEQALWLADRTKRKAEIEKARRAAGLAPE